MKTLIDKYRFQIVAIDVWVFFSVYQFPKLSIISMSHKLTTATGYVRQIITLGKVNMYDFTLTPSLIFSKTRI